MGDRFRRTGLVVLATTLVCLMLSGCRPVLFGLHGDYTWDVENTRISSSLDADAAVGSKISRNTLRWEVVQPTPTTYDWSKPDYVVDQAAARGIQVLFVVRAAPQWANNSTNSRNIPSDPAGFNQFVDDYKSFFTTAVHRYGDRVKHWEVWTEPNEKFFWQPIGLNPTADQARWIDMYAQLYTDTRTAVGAVNSSVELAVGAIIGARQSCCIVGSTFLTGLIDRGVVMPNVAVNPHISLNQAPWTTYPLERNFSDIQVMRDILVSRGLPGVNLWITEFGWQVGGYTSPGSTTTTLYVPGNQWRLALWPNSGQVNIGGMTRDYSSINRNSTFDSDGDGVAELHNVITLTVPLLMSPAAKTEISNSVAESTHATYVREAMRMLRGTYVPQSGRPQQNYSYVRLAVYYRQQDQKIAIWGMYGLFHEPVPNWNEPGEWILPPRPAAQAFMEETN